MPEWECQYCGAELREKDFKAYNDGEENSVWLVATCWACSWSTEFKIDYTPPEVEVDYTGYDDATELWSD